LPRCVALGIGLRTVNGHLSVILRALHVDNRAGAAVLFVLSIC
jgi:DNA-binding NarL/FixJ family response regulator